MSTLNGTVAGGLTCANGPSWASWHVRRRWDVLLCSVRTWSKVSRFPCWQGRPKSRCALRADGSSVTRLTALRETARCRRTAPDPAQPHCAADRIGAQSWPGHVRGDRYDLANHHWQPPPGRSAADPDEPDPRGQRHRHGHRRDRRRRSRGARDRQCLTDPWKRAIPCSTFQTSGQRRFCFWSPEAWRRESERAVSPEDAEYAKTKGFM